MSGCSAGQPIYDWPEQGLCSVLRRGDPDRAGRPLAQFCQRGKLGVDVVERRPERLDQPLASLGRRYAARRAGQQAQA